MKCERCSQCNHKIQDYEIYGNRYHCIHCNIDLPYPPIKREDIEQIEQIQSFLANPLRQAIEKFGINNVKHALRWIYEN